MTNLEKIDFKELLENALTDPSKLMEGYRLFYRYSFYNQMLILHQGGNSPVATYKGWQNAGRQVEKGEKAGISICRPITITKKNDAGEIEKSFTKFKFVRCLFTVDQTSGDNRAELPDMPDFDLKKVLKEFNIKQVDFKHHDGNIQGYATRDREIAINPVAQLPFKTAIHEIAHIIHGHTDVTAHDSGNLPRDIKELEAEGTAYLVCAALGRKEELEYCRGYLQNWVDDIPEKSAKRIIEKTNKILSAGQIK